jgi:Protein of unknown function (DUF4239)
MDLSLAASHVPLPLLGVLVIGGCIGAAITAMLAVRHFRLHDFSEEVRTNALGVLGAVATIYGLILALSAVQVWQDYTDAGNAATHEATEAGDLYRAAAAYGSTDGRRIESAVRDYVQSVIAHEWPRMADAESANATWDRYNALHRAIGALTPQDPRQTIWATQMVRDLAAVADARRDRLDQAANGLPGLYWTIILLGTLVTMLYGGALLPRRANIVVICGLATAMGMVVFFIMALDHPFSGWTGIKPDTMQHTLANMSTYDISAH